MLATAALSACATYTAPAAVRHGGDLKMSVDAYPTSLNPLVAGDVSSVRAYTPLFPHLFGLDAALRPQPDLAASLPAVSADGLTWSVTLRQGALWSDRSPITADDVKFTVDTERSPSLDTDAIFDWSELDQVTVVDSRTVAFKTKVPDVTFVANHLAMPIVPRHVLQGVAPTRMRESLYSSRPTVTGGPFRFDSTVSGRSLVYVANPLYYGGRPRLDRLLIYVTRDHSQLVSAMTSGFILWVPNATQATVDAARGVAAIHVASYPDLGYTGITFNFRAGRPFASLASRRALASALDMGAIEQQVRGRYAVPAWSVFNPQSWAYPAAGAVPRPRDVAAATQALAGQTVTAALLYPQDDDRRARAAGLIAKQAADAGIRLTPTAVPAATFEARLGAGDFDLALTANGQAADPDPSAYLHTPRALPAPPGPTGVAYTDGALNAGAYSDPALDALLDAERAPAGGATTLTSAARKDLLAQVDNRVRDQVAVLPVWTDLRYQAFNDTVQGVDTVGNQYDQDRDSQFFSRWYLSA